MAELYVSVAIATATTMMATILLLSRASVHGRRPAVVLMRRWIGASTRTSMIVLALLAVIAVICLARIAGGEASNSLTVSAQNENATPDSGDSSDPDGSLAALRAYVDNVDGKPQFAPVGSSTANAAALPDVDTMIAKLVTRLQKEPNDVKGWKMLGWSYLNTGRTDDALTAYQTALKLQPGDPEIEKALEQAKATQTKTSDLESPSNAVAATMPADDLTDAQRDAMIRGMVEQLATRLETSPKDEEGWLRLMRSRVTLGDKEAAKAALTKSLAAFADDTVVKTRLSAAAHELGIDRE